MCNGCQEITRLRAAMEYRVRERREVWEVLGKDGMTNIVLNLGTGSVVYYSTV
jgi:hypothetical protein